MRFSHTRSWLLRSAAIVAAAATGALGPASAQTANLTPANVDTLNLLSPFFTLDSSSIGLQTLQANLSQAVAINANAPAAATLNNNLSTPALAALAISDENLLGSAQNTVYGLSKTVTYGPAANLAGGLPVQQTSGWAEYNGQQAIGGLGAVLGAAFVQGVGSNGATVTLPNTVTLLTDALNQTGNTLWAGQTTSTADSQIAKFYFANGTWNGASAAVAPAGSTLPTSAGLPNGTNSVYDLAYGVTNTQSGQNAYGDSHPYQTANLTL